MLGTTRHSRVPWRTWAIPFLAAVLVVPAYSQSSGGIGIIVADGAPVLLLPDRSRLPLTTLAAGTAVQLMGAEGEWLNIEFQDQRFGPRVGYVLKVHVKISEQTAAGETTKRLAAARAAARKATETDSFKPGETPGLSTTCRRIDCISVEDLVKTSPPVLVNQQISATVERLDP